MLSCYPYLLLDSIGVLTFHIDYCLLLKDLLSKDLTFPIFLCISYWIMFKDLHLFELTYFSIESTRFFFSLLFSNQNSLMLCFHVFEVIDFPFFSSKLY